MNPHLPPIRSDYPEDKLHPGDRPAGVIAHAYAGDSPVVILETLGQHPTLCERMSGKMLPWGDKIWFVDTTKGEIVTCEDCLGWLHA